jgi:hypothetical protein
MGFEFGERCGCDAEELQELSAVYARVPLGDVRSDGDCGPPHLVTERVSFLVRQFLTYVVDRAHQVDRSLPHNELIVSLNAQSTALRCDGPLPVARIFVDRLHSAFIIPPHE